MSLITDPMQRESSEDVVRLARYLVQHRGLRSNDLQRIMSLQQTEQLRFSEAALRLGLATQADIDAGLKRADLPEQIVRVTPSRELVSAYDPYHPRAEQIRALRTEILMRRAGETVNILAVVSPRRGEGRSRMAAELAVACSQLEQPTLLVDADLRTPRQHQLFDAPRSGHGLAGALVARTQPQAYPVSGLTHLSVVPAGNADQNPHELLYAPFFAELLMIWAASFQHIILDTPPANEFSDAMAVGSHAGAVVALARADKTMMPEWREMLRRFEAARARVIGSVMQRF